MSFSLHIVEFTGLPRRETLQDLDGTDVTRIDPLKHEFSDPEGINNMILHSAAGMSPGSRVVGYCTGAPMVLAIANTAFERYGTQVRPVFVDPTPVEDNQVEALLSKLWTEFVDDIRQTTREIKELVSLRPYEAAARTRELLEPRIALRLQQLGISEQKAELGAEELVRRYQSWVSYLVWSKAFDIRLGYEASSTLISVDESRQRIAAFSSISPQIVRVPFEEATYLSGKQVLEAIRNVQ